MKLNIYGTTIKHWLVTPEFRLSQNLSFDLALTKYNSADPIASDTLQADDRFVVLIYANDAWHILREWNNSGSSYVYNTISATGENVTIDLSAYYGQKVKIAFYGESTNPTGMANTGGDNDLHIDNIVCGVPVEASEWETIEATESPVILTGLTPETPYEVKLQGFCDGEPTEETEIVTFTTPEQTTLTQAIELTAGVNWVSFFVETNLDDLKAALVNALGTSATITVKSRVASTKYQRGRWAGNLSELNMAEMYLIDVPTDSEISLEGMPIDPSTLSITILPGVNWIAYPYTVEMTLPEFFGSFPITNDVVKSRVASSKYNRGRWAGSLNGLVSGQGYIYNSADEDAEGRIFTFPATAK